jgi:hypothetical protein
MFHKVNELHVLSGADVYLAIRRKSKLTMYNSDPKWIPSEEQIVGVELHSGNGP